MSDYRSEVECLRAENERLTARVAELEAKPMVEKERKADAVPMKWAVRFEWHDSMTMLLWVAALVFAAVFFAICMIIYFISTGTLPRVDAVFLRGLGVWAAFALVWCLAFVRRVPR